MKSAQRTERFTQSARAIGLALGGEAGQQLASSLALSVSADTLLRIIRATLLTVSHLPLRVIGVDDWAWKRGHVYGTLLVDLEHHRPIDLLSDRTAETLAQWLQQHPSIAIVSRDRSTEYRRGISLGAPRAKQVADRWHLLKNLHEVLERILAQLRASLNQLATLPVDASAPTLRRQAWCSSTAEAERQARRKLRLERFEQVRALRKQGVPIKHIAKILQMSRVTVRTYLKAEAFPEMAPRPRASKLDPYASYLQQRWRPGCRNATQLWRELHAQGFTGTRRQVEKWVCVRREEPRRYSAMSDRGTLCTPDAAMSQLPIPAATDKLPAPKKLAWLLLKTKNTLEPISKLHTCASR